MQSIRTRIRKSLPNSVVKTIDGYRLKKLRNRYRNLTTEEAFTSIYRERAWGRGDATGYYSGSGSVGAPAREYVDFIRTFTDDHDVDTVVDLGCGDFRIGNKLAVDGTNYIGVDIVKELVDRNQAEFGSDTVRFVHCDIVEDDLPAGDLCLVRQVLQHLSNSQIMQVLSRLQAYRYCLVTEHYPTSPVVVPNVDKPHGPDTRLVDDSAVCLDQPPFSIAEMECVLEAPVESYEIQKCETLKTFLIEWA